MATPTGDPLRPQPRRQLPDVRGKRIPVGYEAGFQWRERLQGIGLIALGSASAAFTLLVVEPTSSLGNPLGLKPLGLPWLVPILLVGAAGLILVGLRRTLVP